MSFTELGLKPELSRAVAEKGYTIPTPIQREAIPAVLAGRDVLAGAQTGTGKTAAFVLPILQNLGRARQAARPRALVLTPTRELAAQVADSARDYGRFVEPAHRRHLRRRQRAPADRGAAPRLRHPRRHARAPARSRRSRARSSSTRSRAACSTKPTACSTWDSFTPSGGSEAAAHRSARTCCSRRRIPRTSARWRRACCARRWPSKSRRATPPPTASSSTSIACRRITSGTCSRT